ncbi:MAG: GDP-mannose 4,6-dehydratase [Elusimicrobiota bacterium]
MRRAVIVGCGGQDGRLLFDLLRDKGYALTGLDVRRRRCARCRGGGPVDIRNAGQVERLIRRFRPHEVYYLAARHRSAEGRDAESAALLRDSYEIHVLGLLRFLDAMRVFSPRTRLFYASSSLVFGTRRGGRFDERSPLRPDEIYGITKAQGMALCRFYRRRHRLFTASGILFNHESPLRGESFVSRRIVRGAVEVKKGHRRAVVLGDLRAQADWGWAPDYVEAMRRILRAPQPEDFIVATGKKHSVGEFARRVCARLGLDPEKHLHIDQRRLTRRTGARVGDAGRLRRRTGWKPTVDFPGMVDRLLAAELKAS